LFFTNTTGVFLDDETMELLLTFLINSSERCKHFERTNLD